jgi:alpha-L-rhamnosidase
VTASVPPGSTAVIEIPTSEPDRLHEGDGPAVDQVGILAVQPSAAGASVRVTSGRYTFRAPFTGASTTTAPSSRENP